MVKRQAVQKVKHAVEKKGGQCIGALCWWSLEGAEIEAAPLRALYEKHGLGPEWLPAGITGHGAFQKTLREVKRDAGGAMIRPIKDDDVEMVVGVVSEARDTVAERLRYAQEVTIRYHKVHGTIQASDDSHPVVQRVRSLYDAMTRTYVVADFIRLLTRNIRRRMQAVLVRPTGGIYFVPQGPQMEVLEKHDRVFNELGSVEFTVLPLYDDPRTTEEMARKSRKALEQELREIEEEIEEFKTKEPRRDTLERRLVEFAELKKKAALFADMLSIKVADIQQGLKDAAAQVSTILGTVEERLAASQEKSQQKRLEYIKEWKKEKRAAKRQATEEKKKETRLVLVPEAPPAPATKKVAVVKRG